MKIANEDDTVVSARRDPSQVQRSPRNMKAMILNFFSFAAVLFIVDAAFHYQDINEGSYNHDHSGSYQHDTSGHYVYDGSGQYVEYAQPTPRPYDEGKLKQWCREFRDSGLYHYRYNIPMPDDITAEECAKIFQEQMGEQLRVKGYYKYFDENGEKQIIDYTADENGYIPDGNNLHPALLAALRYHKTQGKVKDGAQVRPHELGYNRKFNVFHGYQPHYYNPRFPNLHP